MTDTSIFSEEQKDFLREMMNIGAGNAAATLSELLQRPVESQVPELHIVPLPMLSAILGDPAHRVAAIKLEQSERETGFFFFIFGESDIKRFAELVLPRVTADDTTQQLAILNKISQVVAQSHLDAIRQFCGLTISINSAVASVDMVQAIIDESVARTTDEAMMAIMIRANFVVIGEQLHTYLMLILDKKTLADMAKSIDEARKRIVGGSN